MHFYLKVPFSKFIISDLKYLNHGLKGLYGEEIIPHVGLE